MRKSLLALAFTVQFSFLSFTALAEDWPHWRGPDYTGISKETGWNPKWGAEGPKQLWKANVGIGFSSFAVAKGKVYTVGNASDKDTIFCFDAENGKVVWKHTYPAPLDAKYYEGGTSATPTVHEGVVYSLSKRGDIFALDAESGKVLWHKNLAKELDAELPEWGFAGSVFVLGNNLILNVGTHGTALDKNDGKIVWKTGNKRAGYSTPWLAEINGTKSLMIFAAHDVAAVDPSNGKVQWQHPWKTSYDVNAADPIVQGNQVFISSGYDRGAALLEINGTTPKVLWENKNMRNHMNSSVLIDGHLYGIDGNSGPKATLRCVSWDKGEVKWDLPGTGSGALMAAGKTLIVLTEKGELITAEATPEKFTQISRAQVIGGKNWTVPVLANGRIYCRNSKGDVVALNVK